MTSNSQVTPSPGGPPVGGDPSAGWVRIGPGPWLRRSVVVVLVLVCAYHVVLWAFAGLKSLLGTLFLAWLLAISVEPIVTRLARRGMRRGAATGLVLLAAGLGIALFLTVFGSLLVEQLTQLVRSAPDVIAGTIKWLDQTFKVHWSAQDIVDSLKLTPEKVQSLATQLTGGVFGLVSSVVSVVFQGLTLLLFAFYLSADAPKVRAAVSSRFPPAQQRVIATVWETAVDKTGGYVVSRLLLAGLSSVFIGAFLWLIGVPSWLPLALFTGLVSQFVPTIGTYVAIALPALVALIHQPIDALWVIIFGTTYQQVENYLFAPKITSKTLAIHPAVAFGAVLAGGALFGPIGALVSIPVVAAAQALAETYGRRFELVEAADADAARASEANRAGARSQDAVPGEEGEARPAAGPGRT